MNGTEKYLKKLINEMPEYDGDIHFPMDSDCIDPVKKGGNGFQIKYIFATACILTLLISVPVAAKLPFVTERMQAMPQEEIQDRADMINALDIPADLFSRPFSEEERVRMKSIREEYENGIFPDEDILIVSGNEQTDVDFYYNRDTGMFILPDSRELTDEELRQYIDFSYKADYSLQAQYALENHVSEENENNYDITDFEVPEKHIEIIQDWLTVYDINQPVLTNLKAEGEYLQGYTYSYRTDADTLYFEIYNNTLVYLHRTGDATTETEMIEGTTIPKLEPLNRTDKFESIKEALGKMSTHNCAVSSAWYLCQSDSNGYLRYDAYAYLFTNDAGEGWIFYYENGSAYPDRIMPATYDWWMDNNRKIKKREEQKGIEIDHNVIALDMETGTILSEN